ncbi:hypothetical protein IGI04_003351 [Brassica rapa subsp. trilocularis]|uniref:Uncharacterized protein n=1 Tax=Brassica rapa subsp. trilocularis TaxID=1813537 RepID=A0ABQ7P1K2_BRACM|nr:hypothetical protein IGI04_003351 [Brassica rapa subsp. trilocularis]
MVNSFIFLADLKTGTSLQGLCSPSPSLSTLVIISLLFSISKFLVMLLSQTCFSFISKRYIVPTRLTYNILDGTINQTPQLCSVFAARVGKRLSESFSAAASKLETIRQVDAKNQNAPSETKPLKLWVLWVGSVTGNIEHTWFGYLNMNDGGLHTSTTSFEQAPRVTMESPRGINVDNRNNFFFLSDIDGSLVKEAGSLVNEVKWNIFGSSFIVLDSGLGSEMGDPSHRNLGGKSVKPTQNSISTSGAVNRVRGHWSASKSD